MVYGIDRTQHIRRKLFETYNGPVDHIGRLWSTIIYIMGSLERGVLIARCPLKIWNCEHAQSTFEFIEPCGCSVE